MTTAYDVPPSQLIKSVSEELKKTKKIKPPEWVSYVKTGASREHQPLDSDWWYIRCASLLRKIYEKGPIGVSRLARLYGGKKNRGMKPEKRRRGSGSIIKDALTQLEALGMVKTTKKGRVLTPKGVSTLDKAAHELKKKMPELERY
ncbi:MAG: 30S ribosomal protein S19e [Methanobacteriota archaeon]|nr:MAG: 30S ribosomal protein S19e [Euryarchaeota archaeon]